VGDAVLVVWDEEHRNYTILQETSTLYFLHSDCLDTLGLRPPSGLFLCLASTIMNSWPSNPIHVGVK